MNKRDLIVIIFFLVVSSIFIFLLNLSSADSAVALVYYENDVILRIDMTINETYKVDGYNGEVVIEVHDGSVRVIKETSPLNICSKQGFISKTNEAIYCLPNKIIIKLESDEYDTIVR